MESPNIINYLEFNLDYLIFTLFLYLKFQYFITLYFWVLLYCIFLKLGIIWSSYIMTVS